MYILEESSDVAINYYFIDGDPDVAVEYLMHKVPEHHKHYRYKVSKGDTEFEMSFGRGDPNPIVVVKKGNVPILSSECMEQADPKLINMWAYASTREQESWITWFKRHLWWFFFKVNNKCS